MRFRSVVQSSSSATTWLPGAFGTPCLALGSASLRARGKASKSSSRLAYETTSTVRRTPRSKDSSCCCAHREGCALPKLSPRMSVKKPIPTPARLLPFEVTDDDDKHGRPCRPRPPERAFDRRLARPRPNKFLRCSSCCWGKASRLPSSRTCLAKKRQVRDASASSSGGKTSWIGRTSFLSAAGSECEPRASGRRRRSEYSRACLRWKPSPRGKAKATSGNA